MVDAFQANGKFIFSELLCLIFFFYKLEREVMFYQRMDIQLQLRCWEIVSRFLPPIQPASRGSLEQKYQGSTQLGTVTKYQMEDSKIFAYILNLNESICTVIACQPDFEPERNIKWLTQDY